MFDGAKEGDIAETLTLANDYVNLEWEEFEEKHKDDLLPEVMEYLYDNRDHQFFQQYLKGLRHAGLRNVVAFDDCFIGLHTSHNIVGFHCKDFLQSICRRSTCRGRDGAGS